MAVDHVQHQQRVSVKSAQFTFVARHLFWSGSSSSTSLSKCLTVTSGLFPISLPLPPSISLFLPPALLFPNMNIPPHAQAAPLRSFNGLYTEHRYLLNSLEQQNYSATEILRKVSSLEDKLHQEFPPAVRRRVRKQKKWLKHRLEDTTQQEQAILTGLGQIAHEIHSLQRIAYLEYERWNAWLSSANAPEVQPQSLIDTVCWDGC